MMRHISIFAAFMALIMAPTLAGFTACGDPGTEGPSGGNDIPWEYDDDMDYDSEAFLQAYNGTPYPEAHAVPGTIEAEDFDNGAKNVAWFESDDKPASGYRDGHAVDIRSNGSASNGWFIGDVQPGEWMAYTIEVAEDGTYSIETTVVKGDGSGGSFYFEVDGRGASRPVAMPQGGWEDFTHTATATGISLTKGKHILKYSASDPGNVDKFVITRTGEFQAPGGNSSQYPMTKSMGNPLFTDFPSPMFNSWLTGPLYTADPSAHVWNIDGREVLYIYASHDMEPSAGCDRMDRYHVFSTENMTDWTDHGEIMNAATVQLQAGWGSEGFMWAPDCAYNPADGLYYFYFPHPTSTADWNSTWRIGVATSKYPDKEFTVAGWIEGMPPHIDPCVFVDDDGQPYIYNGGGGKCYGGKLRKDDWTKLDGEMKQMTGLGDFHEATWVHRSGGKYYLSHSDNNSPDRGGNRMKYAMSDSPLGPWKDMGVYLYPTGVETDHGSIVQFKGQWYAFYHTGNYSGHGTLRSVCVDPIAMRADGSFEIVRNWGTPKGGGSTPIVGSEGLVIEAENFNDGGYHYGWFGRTSRTTPPTITRDGDTARVDGLETGEWVRYSFEAPAAGKYSVRCRVSPATSGSRVIVSVNGSHPATNGIQLTGSVGSWGDVVVRDLDVPAGECYLEFKVSGGEVSVDSFVITKQ